MDGEGKKGKERGRLKRKEGRIDEKARVEVDWREEMDGTRKRR